MLFLSAKLSNLKPESPSAVSAPVLAVQLFAGSTAILARLTSRYYGARAGFLAALALNLTGYYGLAASTFALPDGPLLFFWLLTVDRLTVAIEDPDSRRLTPWIQSHYSQI